MDNEELKESLACCAHEGYSCDECPYQKKGHDCEEVSKDALELINNLEAEIEKMKNEEIEDEYNNMATEENLNLKNFVEHYVAHNSVVTLYEEKRLEPSFKEYKKIWTGMDWQIACGPGDEDYFKAHPDVERCPFVSRKVIKVLGGFEDEINTVDSINLCVEEKK